MLLDFLFPSPCVHCNKVGSPLCCNCKVKLDLAIKQTPLGDFPLYFFSDYGEVAKIVNGIKENGLTALIPILAKTIATDWPSELMNVVLVPIPSSRANTKLRGFSHTDSFARAIARKVKGVMVRNLLLPAKRRADQVGLSVEQRRRNLEGAFKVSVAAKPVTPVVIFDDVVTSGATLLEGARTLQQAGVEVLGFCVFARVLGPESQF